MKQYLDLLQQVMTNGRPKADRTGTGTRQVFGRQMRFDLSEGFPLVTTKKVHWKSVVAELLWFLSGSTNVKDLQAMGCTIWDEWGSPEIGCLGPIYGHQFRNFGARPKNIKQPAPKLRPGISPTYLGVGNGEGKQGHHLAKTWEGMMARCYDPGSISYPTYGARGVHVCDRWLEFRAFAEDAHRLPGAEFKETVDARFVLDKDIVGNGFTYGPTTCAWVTDQENIIAALDTIHTVEKGGKTYDFISASNFCKTHDVASPENFSDLWTGNKNAKSRAGFTYVGSRPRDPGIDQITRLVAGLRNNPNDRGHIVSAWNVTDLPYMALRPCHAMFQCDVTDGRLNLQLYQRSADLFLGCPFNIASYALLTHMLAQQCDLEPGEFIWTGGDCHIYDNHVEQVQTQLPREPRPLPTLRIKRHPDDIFSYQPDDFELLGYDPHPAIKAPVAV